MMMILRLNTIHLYIFEHNLFYEKKKEKEEEEKFFSIVMNIAFQLLFERIFIFFCCVFSSCFCFSKSFFFLFLLLLLEPDQTGSDNTLLLAHPCARRIRRKSFC